MTKYSGSEYYYIMPDKLPKCSGRAGNINILLATANEDKPESSEVVAVASEPEVQTQKIESAAEGDATTPPKEEGSIEKKEEEVKAEEKIEVKAEEEEEKAEVKAEEPVAKTEELKEVPASPVSAVVEEKGAVVIVEVANVVVAALSEVPPPLPASPPPVDTALETLSAPLDSLPTPVSPPLLDSAPAAEISVETVVAEMVAKVTQEPIQAVPKVLEEVKDAAEQALKEPVAIISEAVKEVLDTVEVPPPVNEVVKVVETAPTPVEEEEEETTPAPVEPTPTLEPALVAAPEPTEVLVNKLENGFPEPELGQQIIDEPIKKSEDVKSSASEQVSQIQESVTVGNDSTESSKPRTPVEE
uniref:Uncharacterized protein n=1 Tax=Timema monikensis TaxID=170555 RepID=A0A7R9E111_9NEOP|nr:unnamed protein product [Timema monikensis]